MAERLKKPSLKKRKVARIKGAIAPRQELKYLDVASASYAPVAATAVLALLNGIAESDDNTGRDGRQATMKSVALKGYIAQDVTRAAVLARLCIVWDNAPNGVAPTAVQIMSAENSCSYPLLDNQNRFTILRDVQYELGRSDGSVSTAVAGSPSVHAIDLYVPLDAITQFSGTGATIASIQGGALYLLAQASPSTGSATFTLASRVRFSDE